MDLGGWRESVDLDLAYLLPWLEWPAGSQGSRPVFKPSVGQGTASSSLFALKVSFPFNTEPSGRRGVSSITVVLGIFLKFLPDDFLNRLKNVCKSILGNRQANSVAFLDNMQMKCQQ